MDEPDTSPPFYRLYTVYVYLPRLQVVMEHNLGAKDEANIRKAMRHLYKFKDAKFCVVTRAVPLDVYPSHGVREDLMPKERDNEKWPLLRDHRFEGENNGR